MVKEGGTMQSFTNREMQLIKFIRQLGWGEVRLRVENGQPVLIYEAIKTVKLEEDVYLNNKGRKKQAPV
ncbi:hypothetical protein [Desulfofundulus thermocisternus]|uniref:hypothetical protein n=1 Tax=Desulfofundulus thermocisternus TaxID=42471 RepID=UPI0019F9CFB9|nr:hypothetical protein [Desulfofundulus thermocisternus]MBE3586243.1 hypothetical protein [Thermoanaerobacter sp.]MCS5695266.1 hypothetical protein [Desulfofundulus thermocisternus]